MQKARADKLDGKLQVAEKELARLTVRVSELEEHCRRLLAGLSALCRCKPRLGPLMTPS